MVATNGYSEPALKLDNVHALIARVQARSNNRTFLDIQAGFTR